MDSKGKSFDWKLSLNESGFEAAEVSLMKHAPGYELWRNAVCVGMKLMVGHNDIPMLPKIKGLRTRIPRKAYWVGTVLKVTGYYVLFRYEGMTDCSHDFWIHISSVFPVGAEVQNCVLIPPKCAYKEQSKTDWRTVLIDSISGARTLPLSFQDVLRCSIKKCKYKIGDHLEVIDKYKISQLRIARVSKIFGRRMYLRYLDTEKNDGFYCHDQSTLIHSLGWAACVGHKLRIPLGYELPTSLYNNNMDTHQAISKSSCVFEGLLFHEGMKLEAVDPLCPSRICGATICKVLDYGYMMLKMDCYENYRPIPNSAPLGTWTQKSEVNPGFCYHIKSPYIFKCGFCKSNGIALVPPTGYDVGDFSWGDYLEKNGLVAAPLPEQAKLDHGFKISTKLEVVDVMTPAKIHVATIAQMAGRLIRINFDGWDREFDQWMDAESPDIYPVGWCSLVGYKLQPPNHMNMKE